MKPFLLTLIMIATLMPITAFAESLSVDVEGKTYNVDYTGQGVTISGFQIDTDFISLILDVDVTGSPGVLEITLPRGFIDSQFDGTDDTFIIIADGDEPSFEEIDTNSQSRTLSIELAPGTDEVEIIGSVFGSTVPSEEPKEEPTVEEPTTETPSEEPPEEEPKTETPPKEEPKPTEEKPKVECGVGTVLKDGVCVLDERCGPGTILKDGLCVAAPEEQAVSSGGMGKQLIIGVIAAFIISLVVIAFLYVIGRGSRPAN